tara:strand:+ start:39 stop:446 length:408 start_codon:yes stop_codon:yes gene_type:complete
VFEKQKNKSVWRFEIGNLKSFSVVSINRPKITLTNNNDIDFNDLIVTLVDTIEPSTSHVIMKWIEKQVSKEDFHETATLSMLGGVNDKELIEKWTYQGVRIKNVDFCDLSYYDSSPATIILSLSYTQVILHNNNE